MSLVRIKSIPPMYKPIAKLINMTTIVRRIISLRVGHLTFFSSSYVSLRNVIGVTMSKMP